jgi:dihydrofolate reductase
VQSLLQANLIDELRLWVHPIILGKGVHLFNNGLEGKVLKLVDSRMYSTGVLSLLYQATRDVA